MSDLLCISFDCLSSPNLILTKPGIDMSSSGWGIGWYPSDDCAAAVVKDSGGKSAESFTNTLNDWKYFRSTSFICKVRGAAKKNYLQDTQPFQRSFWGRDWLFIHNGDLNKAKLKAMLKDESGFLKPLGSTDSEIAFCYLLQQIQEQKVERIADLDMAVCREWLSALDELGTSDIVLSDSQSILMFHGKNSLQSLYYSRVTPPHPEYRQLSSDGIEVQFEDSRDTFRTYFLLSSVMLNGSQWTPMQKGQVLVVRRGSVKYDSCNQTCDQSYENVDLTQNKELVKDMDESFKNSSQGVSASSSSSYPVVTNVKSMTHGLDGRRLEYKSYTITHTTQYTYTKPVERSTHILRLQPVEDKIQEVVHSSLRFSVEGEQLSYEDVFGNQSIHITVDKPYTQLTVDVESKVRIFESPKDDFSSVMRRTSIPLVWMPWQRQMMLPYLLPPELPESQLLELTDFAMSFVERTDYNLIDTISEMNLQIYQDFKYVQGSTNLQTTPFDVYVSREGVCQDFANLLICLARLLNIPSRYRVGYIYTGSNYENREQGDASHAWVEVYLPYLGWRGFDPTNGCTVGQDHIRVACGRNFRDAAPTTGTLYKGGGKESLFASVQVIDGNGSNFT